MALANPAQLTEGKKVSAVHSALSSLSGLRVRLILIIITALIPAIVFLISDTITVRQRTQQAAQEELLRLTQLAAISYEQRLDEAHRLLTAISLFPEVRNGDAAACSQRLAQMVSLYQPKYSGFGVSNLNGEMFCTSAPISPTIHIADRLWFRNAVQTGEFAVGEFTIGRPSGNPILGLGLPIRDQNGQVMRVLSHGLLLNALQEQATAIPQPADAVLTIVDHKGMILVQTPNGERLMGEPLSPDLFQQMQAQGKGIIEAQGEDSIARLYAFTPISGPSGAQVWLSIGRSSTVLYSEVRKALTRDVIGITSMMLVVLVSLWFGSHKLILYPVHRLVAATNQVAKGDFGTRTGIPSNRGELGQLAFAFDRMADTLQWRTAEQERMQIELLERDQHLQLALESARMVAWTWDFSRDYIQTTDNFASIYGLPAIEYAAQGFALVHIDDREHHQQAVMQAVSQQTPYHSIFRIIRPDTGQLVWLEERAVPVVDAAGQLQKLAGVAADITARKMAELALHASEKRYRQLADAMPQIVWRTDETGQVEYLNQQWLDYTGLTLPESLQDANQAIHPDDRQNAITNWQQAQPAGMPYEFELRLRRYDGIYQWFLSRCVPVRNNEGQIVNWYGTSTDITALKKTEETLHELNLHLEQRIAERTRQLQQKNEELERSNRDLEKFAYIASHDLRAPLRAIDHLSQWVHEDAHHLLPDASKEHLTKLRGRVRRMDTLLDDLLAYSRIGRFHYNVEKVDVRQLLQDIVALANPPDSFRVLLAEGLPVFRTQRVPLEMVLRNLVGNAIKHHHRPDGCVQITAHDEGEWIAFVVSDDGPGIDPQFHDKIFEIFQTLKPRDQVEGSGVGLAIVKKAIEIVGGAITVESSAGNGSIFRFTWPKASQEG